MRLLHQQVGDVLVDRRFLASQRAALGSQVPILLRCLAVDVGCALAQLSLLHAQLTEALTGSHLLLREVAVQACCGLSELGLLRSLLTHGLADVGQLASGRLAKLCTLGGELAKLLAALQTKLGLLHRGLRCLLAQSALRLSLLAVKLTNA